jgi:hypothetical protein
MSCPMINCTSHTDDKPYYEINIYTPKSQRFCSEKCKSRTLKKYIIDDIKSDLYLERTYEECPICLEYSHSLVKLSCNHMFCSICIKNIFDTCTKCPTCKSIIELKSDQYTPERVESITEEHTNVINIFYKLLSSIDEDIDIDYATKLYFERTGRYLLEDIEYIKKYLNIYN